MDGKFAVKSAPLEADAPVKSLPPKPNLREQVQSLRLPAEDEMGGSGRRWIGMVIVLAIVVIGGYSAFKMLSKPAADPAPVASTSTPAPTRMPESLPADTKNNTPISAPPTFAAPSTPTATVASSGEIAHES